MIRRHGREVTIVKLARDSGGGYFGPEHGEEPEASESAHAWFYDPGLGVTRDNPDEQAQARTRAVVAARASESNLATFDELHDGTDIYAIEMVDKSHPGDERVLYELRLTARR